MSSFPFKVGDTIKLEDEPGLHGTILSIWKDTVSVDFGIYGVQPMLISAEGGLVANSSIWPPMRHIPHEPPPMHEQDVSLEEIEEVLACWEEGVRRLETEDYEDEIDCTIDHRDELQGMANRLAAQNMQLPDAMIQRIEQADAKFLEATEPVPCKSLWYANYGEDTYWYFYRWPKKT
ncbi:MAG: hypothetical protein WBL28_08770 [Methylotenera sp.]